MLPRLFFRVDQLIPEHDFEDPFPGGDQGDFVERVLERGKDLVRQTDGSRGVTSLGAVFDRDSHGDRV